jgi:hypothetical protein
MEELRTITLGDTVPQQLVKPIKVEEILESEKVLEALCESRDSCRINTGVGESDDILF